MLPGPNVFLQDEPRVDASHRNLARHIMDHRTHFDPSGVDHEITVTVSTVPATSPVEIIALSDGSLLTQTFLRDLDETFARLFGISALLMLFTINVWISVAFIRRAHVKNKILFYFFTASQLMGPLCFLTLLAPYFFSAQCLVVSSIAIVTTFISYSLLISAILGLKAYRCLNGSRLILAVVVFLQLLIFGLFSLDIRNIQSLPFLSGGCRTFGTIRYIPIALLFTSVESLFLCLCFAYAVWKASMHSAAQGRLSIALSVADNNALQAAITDSQPQPEKRRGWWDYVPQSSSPRLASFAEAQNPQSFNLRRLRDSVLGKRDSTQPPRKASTQSEEPITAPSRANTIPPETIREKSNLAPKLPSTSRKALKKQPSNLDPLQPAPPTSSRSASESSIPAYETLALKELGTVPQIKAVIKTEFIHSILITISTIISTVVTFWGASKQEVYFGSSVWLGANWAFISLIVMRSFSQVVKRHEKEALLHRRGPSATLNQNTSAWLLQRRDAIADFEPYGGVSLAGSLNALSTSASASATEEGRNLTRLRRTNGTPVTNVTAGGRRTSFDEWDIRSLRSLRREREKAFGSDGFDDDASIRRKEGVMAWIQERNAARQNQGSTNQPSTSSINTSSRNASEGSHEDGAKILPNPFGDFEPVLTPTFDSRDQELGRAILNRSIEGAAIRKQFSEFQWPQLPKPQTFSQPNLSSNPTPVLEEVPTRNISHKPVQKANTTITTFAAVEQPSLPPPPRFATSSPRVHTTSASRTS